MYRAGHIADITLQDLPGFGRWAIHGYALVLDAACGELLLCIYQFALGAMFFAQGVATNALDTTDLVIQSPVTTGLAPARIRIGRIINLDDLSTELDDLVQRAHTELAAARAARGDGPLGLEHLALLDAAQTEISARRAAVTQAERARDGIVRRMIQGGVRPARIARPGLSSSRISQIAPMSALDRAGAGR